MRRIILIALGCAFCVAVSAKQPEKYRDDTILVKPKRGISMVKMQGLHKQLGGKATHTFRGIGNLQIVKLPKGLSVEKALEIYKKSGKVEYAEPDYQWSIADCNPPSSPPNDPDFLNGVLWAMHNYGQNGGTCNVDIDAPQGWQVATSAEPVIVAVIDTGIRYTHEDLWANMWTNPCVSCPVSGVVYTNDVYGINAITDTGDPWDDHFHGTHCAGTIGAVGNNGKGVVGVAWNVRLMALKFLNEFGFGWDSDAIKCIDYARAKGAKVMSNSWGGAPHSQALRDAITAARDAGIIFVAAAGNNNRSNDGVPFYPATYGVDNIVSVAATDRNDARASFSNWGSTTVHLGAPGVAIYSTYNTSDSAYQFLQGTSMATPHVAGVCAMLTAQYPSLAYSNVIQRLLLGVDYTDAMKDRTITGGRLNFGRAIRDPIADFTATPSPTQAMAIVFTDRSVASNPSEPITQRLLEFGDGYSSSNPNVSYIYSTAGNYTATLTVQNGSGSTSVKTRKINITAAGSQLAVQPGLGFLDPSGFQGGPFTPASQTFIVHNLGGATMNWSAFASPSVSWISISNTNGTLAPGASTNVVVAFNAATDSLDPGIYETSVIFSNHTASGSTARGVRLQVKAPPGTLTISPSENYFAEGPEGGPFTPGSKQYTLQNNSTSFDFDWSTFSSASWPFASPEYGTLNSSQNQNVTLTIDPSDSSIGIGTNTAVVVFRNDTTEEEFSRNVTVVANQVVYVTPNETFVSEGPEGGAFAPASKTYSLLYTGQGTLNWYAESTDVLWNISPNSGSLTNNQSVNVVASVSNVATQLASGIYDGAIGFLNGSTDYLYQSRATQLIVGDARFSVTPAQGLSTTGPRGGPFNPASKVYQLSWAGADPVQWEVELGATWLSASPASGTLSNGGSMQVTITLNGESVFLPRGTNTSSIVFRKLNGPVFETFPVSLIATQETPGAMSITPKVPFYSSGPVGGPFSPTNATYTLSYAGPAPLFWTAFPNSGHFDATPESGVLTNGQSVQITVFLTPYVNELWDELYEEVIRVYDANSTDFVDIDMNVDVGNAGVLSVSPSTGVTASGPQGGPFSPASVTYTLQNTGGHWIGWSATKLSTWITLSQTIGAIPPGGSTNVTVSFNVNAGVLPPGAYSDTVNFINTISGNSVATRAVSLTVNTPGALSVTPADGLTSSGTQGGPFSPTSRVYTLQNTGGSAINWTVSKNASWVSLSATSGSLAASASTNITVSINNNANSLGAGNYSDTVNFTNTTNGDGNTTRAVSLTVSAAPGVLSVTPAGGLTSSGTQGGPFSPSSQVYTLQNTGGQSINWTASKAQSWVSLSAASGSLAAGASTNVTVSINSNANSLSAGNYSDTVNFTNTTNGNGNTTRSVSLTVNAPPGVLSVSPAGGLSSSGCQGGPFSPSSQVYTLQNTGGQTINWTASKSQTWVTLSAANGSLAAGASTNVQVSINSNADALGGGNYSDTVSFTNTSNGNGNTTRAVSLSVTTATLNAPTNLTATNLSGPAVRLDWTETATCEDGFAIERAVKSGSSWGAFSQIGTTGANATTYTDSTVAKKKSYRYRVRAFDGTTYGPYSAVVEINVP